jgi:hypothetical protein
VCRRAICDTLLRQGVSIARLLNLWVAIDHLIATCGETYAKGPEFLERLKGPSMDNPRSAAFIALKRDALVLENPAIDFDNILLVQAKRNGRRYASNWQTRVSCDPKTRPCDERDLRSQVACYEDALVVLHISMMKGIGCRTVLLRH